MSPLAFTYIDMESRTILVVSIPTPTVDWNSHSSGDVVVPKQEAQGTF